ncbi:unnamed protein product [Leptosia nina]|uniref:Uncharacterized protein n=1 Tax=Leptosia nina TaxID=320188 RepID=A0AAV1JEJ2_9NEOP
MSKRRQGVRNPKDIENIPCNAQGSIASTSTCNSPKRIEIKEHRKDNSLYSAITSECFDSILENTRGYESFERTHRSNFTESNCADIVKSQRIIIDFTENNKEDGGEVMKKCLDFWAFVDQHPQLEKFIVKPEALPPNRFLPFLN